jgi:prevent-host-death family protein
VTVTVTEFRRNLFKLLEKVIAGETVEVTHRGTTIRIVVPERRTSRLERLTPRTVTNPELTEAQQLEAERKLRTEMLAEMEKDWAEL